MTLIRKPFRLGELAGTWLVVNCHIPEHGRYFSTNGLVEKHGAGRTLGERLPRFHCQQWGSRPAEVILPETQCGTAGDGGL
jgi:hypothetical protein